MATPRTLKINETFLSLQGESTHSGRLCSFVRLMGCPLRCTYCDTEYAFHDGKTKSFDELFETLKNYGAKLVEVTGGEPLAQKNCIAFMQELVSQNYEVLLETSGAYPIQDVPQSVSIILDVKTPGSGEAAKQLWDNMAWLKPNKDEVKFVVKDKADFKYALKVCENYNLLSKHVVLMSPVHGVLSNKDLAEWIVESKKPFRFQVQLHKYIWGENVKGV